MTTDAEIVEAVRNNPGITTPELARMFSFDWSARAHTRLNSLARYGMIERIPGTLRPIRWRVPTEGKMGQNPPPGSMRIKCEAIGLSYKTYKTRLAKGWNEKDALKVTKEVEE